MKFVFCSLQKEKMHECQFFHSFNSNRLRIFSLFLSFNLKVTISNISKNMTSINNNMCIDKYNDQAQERHEKVNDRLRHE